MMVAGVTNANDQAHSLIDVGTAISAKDVLMWIISDHMIRDTPQAMQGYVNAVYCGLAWLIPTASPRSRSSPTTARFALTDCESRLASSFDNLNTRR